MALSDQTILDYIAEHPGAGREAIRRGAAPESSDTTVWRALKRLVDEAGQPLGGPIPAGTYARRILEQLLVDLSWASSRMEGNTYDILQTERLIRYGEEAAGKDRKEALMILNHKEAIQCIDAVAERILDRHDYRDEAQDFPCVRTRQRICATQSHSSRRKRGWLMTAPPSRRV